VTSTYDKPFLEVDAQLDRLQERGLVFDDRELAYRELQAIGYYRLSGYWYPFRQKSEDPQKPRPSKFVEGATLQEVLEIYRFDERLRVEILHALSHIEVALRFQIGHLLGRRGPFTHNNAAELDSSWTTPQRQFVMSSFVVAGAGSGLADPTPIRPVPQVGEDVPHGTGDTIEQSSNLVDSQRDQLTGIG